MKLKYIIGCLVVGAALMLTGCGKTSTEPVDTTELIDGEIAYLGNTSGNINNKGGMCADSQYMYYQKVGDDYKLYRSNLDGSDETKLNDLPSYFINVYKDKIYYAVESDGFSVYTMNKDGSDNKRILEAPANYMTIYNDSIYYSNPDDNSYIYKASLDGTNNERIFQNVAYYLTAYKNNLYFVNTSDNAKIYRTDLDGNEPKVIVDDYCAFINLYNDYIYYVTPPDPQTGEGQDYLHRYSLIDGTVDDLLEVPCQDVNIANDRIYYTHIDEGKVYSCDLEGQDIQVEVDERAYFINIAGNRIQYIYKIDDSNFELREKELD